MKSGRWFFGGSALVWFVLHVSLFDPGFPSWIAGVSGILLGLNVGLAIAPTARRWMHDLPVDD